MRKDGKGSSLSLPRGMKLVLCFGECVHEVGEKAFHFYETSAPLSPSPINDLGEKLGIGWRTQQADSQAQVPGQS